MEYELACKKRFADEDSFYEKVIRYLQTKKHVPGITKIERNQVWKRSKSFKWCEKGKFFYVLGSYRAVVFKFILADKIFDLCNSVTSVCREFFLTNCITDSCLSILVCTMNTCC